MPASPDTTARSRRPARTLSTADERRESVLEAAMHLFAQTGMHATSTLAVAKAAGISQAYLFRLFPTKDDLVIAVARRCHERIHDAFAAATAHAERAGSDPLEAMGAAYVELVSDRELLTLQLHAQAASIQHEGMREVSREAFRRLVDLIRQRTDATHEEIQRFMAHGMLINVMTAIGAAGVDEDWARILTHEAPEPCDPA
jgi:AcrR family transcriptional regulator